MDFSRVCFENYHPKSVFLELLSFLIWICSIAWYGEISKKKLITHYSIHNIKVQPLCQTTPMVILLYILNMALCAELYLSSQWIFLPTDIFQQDSIRCVLVKLENACSKESLLLVCLLPCLSQSLLQSNLN